MTAANATTTYYFGKTDGKDTLSFGALTGSQELVIAVDAAYGATSGIQFGGDLDAWIGYFRYHHLQQC